MSFFDISGELLNTNNISKVDITTNFDHRIAMSFIIAGISSGNYNKIDDIECINISFPEFTQILNKILK